MLLYGHAKNAYWYGSQLSIEETRELAPYQNATGLQVTSAVLAGIVWMLENPDRGIVEADEMDFRRCLEIQRPYLGPVFGTLHRLDAARRPRRAVPGGPRHAATPGSSRTCWCAEHRARTCDVASRPRSAGVAIPTHSHVDGSTQVAARHSNMRCDALASSAKVLTSQLIRLLRRMPNFARACGRVSIGGHPDKRPDSRLRKRLHFLAHAIGSRRRNRRTPLSTGDAA